MSFQLSGPWHTALLALGAMLLLGVLTWLASLHKRDASLADRIWPVFMVVAACVQAWAAPPAGASAAMFWLLIAWAVRLGAHITWRNWGHGEDRRYAAMRERHGPAFAFKSLYIVFGLQAVMAWVIAAPLFAGLPAQLGWGWLQVGGAALALFGIVYEAVADWQLARFVRNPANRHSVMNRGLWRLSRHPNYFGEICVWWGLGFMALSTSTAWCPVSPLLLTLLLNKVSGVSLLEQDIEERRPGYSQYVAQTPALVPRLWRGPQHSTPEAR
jgi:steroid 5-alpha reductase family enzyme